MYEWFLSTNLCMDPNLLHSPVALAITIPQNAPRFDAEWKLSIQSTFYNSTQTSPSVCRFLSTQNVSNIKQINIYIEWKLPQCILANDLWFSIYFCCFLSVLFFSVVMMWCVFYMKRQFKWQVDDIQLSVWQEQQQQQQQNWIFNSTHHIHLDHNHFRLSISFIETVNIYGVKLFVMLLSQNRKHWNQNAWCMSCKEFFLRAGRTSTRKTWSNQQINVISEIRWLKMLYANT